MFNLEAQIKAWRAQLIRAGLDNPQSITELEGHLREDVEQQIRLGASPQQALEGAAGRIGNVEALKREFAKAGPSRRLQISRLLGIVCAALAGLSVWAGGSCPEASMRLNGFGAQVSCLRLDQI